MNLLREYKLQNVFVVLHSTVIIGGVMITGTAMKVFGRSDVGPADHFGLWFVRNWGFLLILISFAWSIATIWLEKTHHDWFSKRNTVVSGLIVLGALVLFFFGMTSLAAGSLIQVVH